MFTLGVPEMAVIFILALVLFGPKKLPELGRNIGKAMTEFRRASNDLKATFEREMHTLERDTKDIQATTHQTVKELSDHVSYGLAPSENLWNALEEISKDEISLETAPPQDTPATVGASEVSGAESTVETAAAEPAEQLLLLPEEVLQETASEPAPDHPIHS